LEYIGVLLVSRAHHYVERAAAKSTDARNDNAATVAQMVAGALDVAELRRRIPEVDTTVYLSTLGYCLMPDVALRAACDRRRRAPSGGRCRRQPLRRCSVSLTINPYGSARKSRIRASSSSV
jgi:hypothetical protein